MDHLAAALPALLQGGRAINGKDSAVFWWLLYVMVRFSDSLIHTQFPAAAHMPHSCCECAVADQAYQ